ncbi:hypothetical protein MRX96_008279 [Rhipicephalus microplus]
MEICTRTDGPPLSPPPLRLGVSRDTRRSFLPSPADFPSSNFGTLCTQPSRHGLGYILECGEVRPSRTKRRAPRWQGFLFGASRPLHPLAVPSSRLH